MVIKLYGYKAMLLIDRNILPRCTEHAFIMLSSLCKCLPVCSFKIPISAEWSCLYAGWSRFDRQFNLVYDPRLSATTSFKYVKNEGKIKTDVHVLILLLYVYEVWLRALFENHPEKILHLSDMFIFKNCF